MIIQSDMFTGKEFSAYCFHLKDTKRIETVSTTFSFASSFLPLFEIEPVICKFTPVILHVLHVKHFIIRHVCLPKYFENKWARLHSLSTKEDAGNLFAYDRKGRDVKIPFVHVNSFEKVKLDRTDIGNDG